MAVGEKEKWGNYIILVDGKGREGAQGEKCGRDREGRSAHQNKQLSHQGHDSMFIP